MMKSIYKNNGKRWSDEEDAQLLQELSEKIDFETISATHNRSISAIKARIYIKVVNDHKNGIEKELIFDRYNINEEKFEDALVYVQKMENKKDKESVQNISEKNKEVSKIKKEINKPKKEEVEESLLLKELLLEVREIKLMMKEFIYSFQLNLNENE